MCKDNSTIDEVSFETISLLQVHVTNSLQERDHCITYPLSDSADEDYQQKCKHSQYRLS